LRVLINALSARLGGGQTYIVNLLKFLPPENSVEVFLLAPDSLEIPADCKNVTRIHAGGAAENPFLRAVWERAHLPRLLRQLRANVLFCPGGIIGAKIPREFKTVTMFRNMIPFADPQRSKYPLGYSRVRHWLLKRAILQSMKKADLVIFISEYARRIIEDEVGGQLKKIEVIPNGINPIFRVSKNRNHQTAWRRFGGYILYVSSVDFYKAQVEVVQAYALLKKRRQTNEKLILVGPEFPDYGRKVREEIAKLCLQEDVLLLGMVPYEKMPELYQNAVVNIFASECETCPNILLEALAAGRPMVVSKCDPMPEFAGDAVLYFDPKSPDELAHSLAMLLEDSELTFQLGNRALERSMLYDGSHTVGRTWNAINGLVVEG
jgi:glycosyltransferase involved in cell wall biosynthesis